MLERIARGGTYGVLSSSDFARAMSASRLETVAWVPVFSTGVSARCPKAAVQAVSASAVCDCVHSHALPPTARGETRAPLDDKGRKNGDTSCTRTSYSHS